jgi:hypothetical protein
LLSRAGGVFGGHARKLAAAGSERAGGRVAGCGLSPPKTSATSVMTFLPRARESVRVSS